MLNLNIPKIDTALAEEGAWVEFQPGISFLIRRERTPQYVSAIQAIHKRHKRQLDAGTASNEVIDAAMAEALNDTSVDDLVDGRASCRERVSAPV